MSRPSAVRALAFYLPQFHPVDENDEWWGKGFTEWRNVAKAKPLFPGHYQPHLPADLGFYDLRVPEVREAQAALAREHGIGGFVYYHYWFNGRRILERPFNEVLASGKPDFPFCLCWANENWTRVWDGGAKHVLLAQNYGTDDDRAHIESLIPAFKDPRYIRVDGRPLFIVYRAELLPDARRTAAVWREVARQHGLPDLYLANVENFERDVDPASYGFDAAIEFAPDGRNMGRFKFRDGLPGLLSRWGVIPKAFTSQRVVRYPAMARGMMARPQAPHKRFRCVTPGWDNSARRKVDARIIIDSTPAVYEEWLRHAARQTLQRFAGEERLVFVNAWNEWAEGCHLEPDQRWGRAYLEATRRALERAAAADPVPAPASAPAVSPVGALRLRNLYWRLRSTLATQRELLRLVFSRVR